MAGTARVTILDEVPVGMNEETGTWNLVFQNVVYVHSTSEPNEYGYRFIWRRPDGSLQAARGQARIPSKRDLEKLTKLASDAGWYK